MNSPLPLREQAALAIIRRFMKRFISIHETERMMRTGRDWRHGTAKLSGPPPSMALLRANHAEIAQLKSTLSPQERLFLARGLGAPFYCVHYTPSYASDLIDDEGRLTLYCSPILKRMRIDFMTNMDDDGPQLGNANFVFFALECGFGAKPRSRFGLASVRVPLSASQFTSAMFHMDDPAKPDDMFRTAIPQLSPDSQRVAQIYGSSVFQSDSRLPKVWRCTFHGRAQFLEALLLHLIQLLRQLEVDEREMFLTGPEHTELLNLLFHKVFRPQVCVPRLASFGRGEYVYACRKNR